MMPNLEFVELDHVIPTGDAAIFGIGCIRQVVPKGIQNCLGGSLWKSI